uniref:Calponin-homology (CH) domain-containing protein n=1 Tax=Phytophthora ramorum TaxID=164328 RepID=H3GJ14_PHYRM
MADLLLRWLNHELELSTHVTDVEADFASGYLLGEILHRLNHQHNFADFIRSSSADAKILNFCLLEPSLRNLNIKFDANTAAAVMNEKRDAAANLLYQIKVSEAVGRRFIPVKLAKPAYDVENHRQFEHSVRRHVRSIASLQQEKGRIAEEATKRQAYLARKAEHGALLETTKAERLHRAFIHSSYIKEALEETDSPAWRLALQKKNAWEQRRAAFFQQLMQKREEAESPSKSEM